VTTGEKIYHTSSRLRKKKGGETEEKRKKKEGKKKNSIDGYPQLNDFKSCTKMRERKEEKKVSFNRYNTPLPQKGENLGKRRRKKKEKEKRGTTCVRQSPHFSSSLAQGGKGEKRKEREGERGEEERLCERPTSLYAPLPKES